MVNRPRALRWEVYWSRFYYHTLINRLLVPDAVKAMLTRMSFRLRECRLYVHISMIVDFDRNLHCDSATHICFKIHKNLRSRLRRLHLTCIFTLANVNLPTGVLFWMTRKGPDRPPPLEYWLSRMWPCFTNHNCWAFRRIWPTFGGRIWPKLHIYTPGPFIWAYNQVPMTFLSTGPARKRSCFVNRYFWVFWAIPANFRWPYLAKTS